MITCTHKDTYVDIYSDYQVVIHNPPVDNQLNYHLVVNYHLIDFASWTWVINYTTTILTSNWRFSKIYFKEKQLNLIYYNYLNLQTRKKIKVQKINHHTN